MSVWRVKAHRVIKKEHIPLLEQSGLKKDFDEIVETLKENPFANVRRQEKLSPKSRGLYSMRINNKHRVVYSVNKKDKEVTILAAWSHYEKNIPKK
ncbi:Txe/YoeB family addiction module toxin [Tetragenococcus halophilus]|uniref:Endoribonuclease YoeB n=1 Tax=Tetragenococcus halophilus (strain DSM 20338 / JCM 20259 / NCIMB 9735 / NBRC 12172) TaxID=945021 RepID=A0AAN1SGQ6_TETHN|nr:Txe/YoeB family addiction module toxin [Tetragenococcus halophilus]MCO7026250.1 Txe/YoeB family addiction module toxin [Tetragenococcus halophilus]MCO8283944.1 Txe/YoeB family addiction module toxin [Tetragenococcus halophilus]MCO8286316.1 Txe/YoeB family addiction module toxin [Tetragenococcus halophilus]NWN99387.1 Txe/YoeB family addiction module toxin [Tetragenococcus halophilus]QXN86043.1 Txe/YoeB family addiction module toxin [Tetragenococcus halophilus]